MATTRLILVGDSDIDRWPDQCKPFSGRIECRVSGHGGATLAQIIPFVEEELAAARASSQQLVFFAVCAGENDIGNDIPQWTIEKSFHKLLAAVFAWESNNVHLIYLGPKLEPWLRYDPDSRKRYIQLSMSLKRMCESHQYASNNIHYIDCLTMFCGESAQQPGALFGGSATADPQYFDADGLHLSHSGYAVWQEQIENCISKVIAYL